MSAAQHQMMARLVAVDTGHASAVKGRFGLQMRGVMVNNASRLIHTTLVKNGSQVWRVVTIGMNGREPESAATDSLRAALLQTLPDRPERPQRVAPTDERGASI